MSTLLASCRSGEGFFAAELQHFSASVHPDVEAQVVGTLSLTPRCSVT